MYRLSIALLAGISALATAQIASAADMPVKAPRAPLIAPYNWTGFYVGANVGYAWGPWDASSSQVIFDPSTTHDPKVNGALGGLQAGYNWQSGAWVYGLEGDIQITGAKDSDNWTAPGAPNTELPSELADFLPGPPGGGAASFSHEWKFPWFATFRGRIGFLPAERVLVYATGGLAVGESKYNMTFSQPGAGRFYSLSDNETRAGWTVGAGIETVIASRWSAKLEYLYVDLGTHSIDTVDVDGAPFHVENRVRDHILRVGLNYKLW
jgi:outer membrane immunogenic protein